MKLLATPLFDTATPIKQIEDLSPDTFIKLLDRQKAVLFQGVDGVLDVQAFGRFVVHLQLTPYPYVGGAAPRTIINVAAGKDIVFTANESPPAEPIPFHHELAQTPNPPHYIFFYCDTPAEEGGETPIIDSTAVYRYAKEHHPDFIAKLLEHGVRYTRTLPAEDDPLSPIGRSYKNAYCVANREELDAKLGQVAGCRWTWLDDGSVRVTTEAVPAVRLVTDSHHHFVYQYSFSNSIVAAYLGWQDSRNDRHQALKFGNDEPMPEDVLESIAGFMQRERVLYRWKKGDIMALNNQRTSNVLK